MSRVPRPDLDAQLWLVGRLPESVRRTFKREPLHALRGSEVYCQYEGVLEVQEVLWPDWAVFTTIDGPEPCTECARLGIRREQADGVLLTLLYEGRSSKKFRDIKQRVEDLAPTPPPGTTFDYRLDVGRAQFDDGIGDFVRLWRFARPLQERPKKRVLP